MIPSRQAYWYLIDGKIVKKEYRLKYLIRTYVSTLEVGGNPTVGTKKQISKRIEKGMVK